VNTRPETLEELNKVMEYLGDKDNHATPILLTEACGTTSVWFDWGGDCSRNICSLGYTFHKVLKSYDGFIIPSEYAECRAADLLVDHAKNNYDKAVNYRDKKMKTCSLDKLSDLDQELGLE
jgi:hypothetical protein